MLAFRFYGASIKSLAGRAGRTMAVKISQCGLTFAKNNRHLPIVYNHLGGGGGNFVLDY